MTQYAIPFDGPQIERQILNTRLANLLAYWKLDDPVNTVYASDSSNNDFVGTASNVVWNVSGVELPTKSARFNGSSSLINTYSLPLSGVFNGNAGTMSIWAKVSGSGVWTDNAIRYIFRFSADANNFIRIYKQVDNMIYYEYRSGGTSNIQSLTTTETEWMHFVLTWDKAANSVVAYFNGVQVGSLTGLGVWAGALSSTLCAIGARNTTPLEVWSGDIAHAALWDVALSADEVLGLYTYSSELFSRFLYQIGSFIIPGEFQGTSKSLAVDNFIPAVNGTVRINAGKAVVRGIVYVNDDNMLSKGIDAAVNNRIDRIILRKLPLSHTVRVDVLKGVEGANPAPPSMGVDDFPLAWIWVPAGFNPAADPVEDWHIHDDRIFLNTGETAFRDAGKNLMHNSEFIAYSRPAALNIAPEGWKLTALAPTFVLGAAALTTQPRGRSIRIQDGIGNRGIQTKIRVEKGKWYTLRGTINVLSGNARVDLSVASGPSALDHFLRTGTNQEFIMRCQPLTGEEISLEFTGASVAADFRIGQLILTQGWVPGYYRHKHETIMLNYALTDAAWTATAKSTSLTLIDLTASFGSMLTADTPIRGIIMRLRGNDSGSVASACSLYTTVDPADAVANRLSYLRLQGVSNDSIREVIAYAPMIGGLGTTFYVGVIASGANTLDATIEIIGIIT